MPEVADYLENLVSVLYEHGYFGNKDACRQYVDRLVNFASGYLGVLTGKPAPAHFMHGMELDYIAYTPNKRTTWYILYQQQAQQYIVYHITNNHAAGQYFNG